MVERRNERQVHNYTFFLGNLTEEEQQYRDYFETDLEEDSEDEYLDQLDDEARLANSGEFDPKLYDFLELSMVREITESVADIIDDKIFKFKYRMNADPPAVYEARNKRMLDRFFERAKTRDPMIETNLDQLYYDDSRDFSMAARHVDGLVYRETAKEDTQVYREYMAREGVQQYRDYYEDAVEEQPFFEYLDNLSNRDQIRFMECFTDYTVDKHLGNKGYVLVPKREFNPEISAFSNFLLDLVDFKDRVRPLANDIARHDAAMTFQRHNAAELTAEQKEFNEGLTEGSGAAQASENAAQSVEEGYSSLEIAAETAVEEVDAAEPDLEANIEDAEAGDASERKKKE